MKTDEVKIAIRLARELVPTGVQVLGSIVVALVVLVAEQSREIFSVIGISDEAIESTRHQLMDRFNVILQSNIAATIALVTFWAAIGLIAYLVCWGVYSVIVEARNETIIETQYTNHPRHWRGALETLALKALFAVLLIIYISTFKYGLALWLAATATLLGELNVGSVLLALAGVMGLAVQLYGLLLLLQLTFTPWYRPEAFTDLKN